MRKIRRLTTDTHLTRQELIRAARGETVQTADHLAACRECREAVRLLQAFDVVDRDRLIDAPRSLIRKAAVIPESETVLQKARRIIGEVIFDSWALPQPAGVRGDEIPEQRRLRFAARGIHFDIRTERTRSGWDCVGQVTRTAGELSAFVLVAGKEQVTPDADGFYLWSAKTPPKRLSLHAGDTIIELPELKWRRPQKE